MDTNPTQKSVAFVTESTEMLRSVITVRISFNTHGVSEENLWKVGSE